jgi:hypothetical protein
MSAIDFDRQIERLPNPKGDRVKITMSGKFLPYKYYGNSGNVPDYGSRLPEFNQLILWARARADDTPISELCRTWRWPRSSFDQRLEEIPGRVAAYLNKRQAETPSQAASSSPLESRDCPRERRLSPAMVPGLGAAAMARQWVHRRSQSAPGTSQAGAP